MPPTLRGFLFTVSLHFQSGMGDSALRIGLTFAPAGIAFGLAGYHWRRLPVRVHHTLTTVAFLIGGIGYLVTALVFEGQQPSSVVIAASLLVFGAGLGLGFAPLMTHTLVRVPPASAADASGLVTTTFQLGQVIGIAVFGSLFLSLAARPGPHSSVTAIATTLVSVSALIGLGALLSVALARTVLRARTTG